MPLSGEAIDSGDERKVSAHWTRQTAFR